MNTIFKYVLTGPTTVLEVPAGSKPLCVQEQNGSICLWLLIDTMAPHVTRMYKVYGTGHRIMEDPSSLTYVGTCHMQAGQLVWHVFECGVPRDA